MSNQKPQALAGIKILDLARLGPGPHSSQILGDFGAEVITVEPPISKKGVALKIPRGAPIRRNTRSIRLNLKNGRGQEILKKLVEQSDVVVEGFRPGVAKRLNIDYESLKAIKEDIIVASLSGFGQDGPYNKVVGHDINYQGIAGFLDMTGGPDGKPGLPGTPIADNAGGIGAALAITTAIIAKQRTGQGQYIDFSMVDTLMTMMFLSVNAYADSGKAPTRGSSFLTGAFPWYSIYECSDGKYVTVGCVEPWFYENLCRLLGREDFIENQRVEGEEREKRFRVFREIFKTKTRDEWVKELMFEETCVGPVYSVDEVVKDPHLRERGIVLESPDPDKGEKTQVGPMFHLPSMPGRIRHPAPKMGADTPAVMAEIGYSDADTKDLAECGAISLNESTSA